MRRPVIAGNWKMFKTVGETGEFFDVLLPAIDDVDHCDIVVAPPFTALGVALEKAQGSRVAISAQDLYWEEQGAFTGEISATMLSDVGCSHVIIGHSERRQHFGETDETVSWKIPAAIRSGLTPIVCVGETLEQREGGLAEGIVKKQLSDGLARLTENDLSHIIIAYEPVWAIGTGRTATPDIAGHMHAAIRSSVSEISGAGIADGIRILYGGSVKPSNIAELMAQANIDGALVGGASLESDSFASIIRYRTS